MQFLLESFRALWSSLRIFYLLVPIQIFVSFFSEKEQQIHSTPRAARIEYLRRGTTFYLYLGTYFTILSWKK